MKRQKSALPGTNGKRLWFRCGNANGTIGHRGRSGYGAHAGQNGAGINEPADRPIGRPARTKYRSQAANSPFCGAMKSHPAQRNETTGRSGTEKRAYRGEFRPADKKRFRRRTMERRHRNARQGPTDSRRIESVVGLRTAFEDRNPDSATSIRTKPPRIGTTDRSVDLLVGRGPSTENTPDGPAEQTGRGRQKRTDRFR